MTRAALALLALCMIAGAQDVYDFVDRSTGTTNGPVLIRPSTDVCIGGRKYELHPSRIRFRWETNVVPVVDLVNASIGDALGEVLPACGITTNGPARVVVFRDSLESVARVASSHFTVWNAMTKRNV